MNTERKKVVKNGAMAAFAAAGLMAGCVVDRGLRNGCDPVVGNWVLEIPDDGGMNASTVQIRRDRDGKATGEMLWRWAEPKPLVSCETSGGKFCIVHPWSMILTGEVSGDEMTGLITFVKKDGTADLDNQLPLVAHRSPSIEPTHTSFAKFGEPIDLLKDGLDGWESMNAKAKFGWSFKDGVLSNKLGTKPDGSWAGGGANLKTKRADFYDFNLSYDVRVPKRSNSGVYLRGRYEIQVVDSYGQPTNSLNMAALYGRITPKVAAEKPAGEWQHVDVTLYRRHLTVVLNGTKIIDNEPVLGATGGAFDANEFVPGPIYLQGDHSDADYKNMILRPVIR